MTDESHKLSITYSSGLIPPPEIMGTLAVFYDEGWLPNPGVFEHLGEDEECERAEIDEDYRETAKQLKQSRKYWQLLFEQHILRTLSAPVESFIGDPKVYLEQRGGPQYVLHHGEKLGKCLSRDERVIFPILLEHALFANKPSPELFISDPTGTHTFRLAGVVVQSLFQYHVPQLGTLNADQILEVREYLKDTKEGFTYYIHEMTDDVEQRIKSGNLSEIEAAQKTFERKILPQDEEFRRQLAARKTGYWSNVLSASADFLKVDATPWTPKFYGELLKWLGVALNLTAKDEEALLTNKNQAFQYLARLESKVSRTTS